MNQTTATAIRGEGQPLERNDNDANHGRRRKQDIRDADSFSFHPPEQAKRPKQEEQKQDSRRSCAGPKQSKQDDKCEWQDLPREMIECIISFCDGARLASLSCVSRELHQFIRCESLAWQKYLERNVSKDVRQQILSYASVSSDISSNVSSNEEPQYTCTTPEEWVCTARRLRRLPIAIDQHNIVSNIPMYAKSFQVCGDLIFTSGPGVVLNIYSMGQRLKGRVFGWGSSPPCLESPQLSPDGRYVLVFPAGEPFARMVPISLLPDEQPCIMHSIPRDLWDECRWTPDSKHLIRRLTYNNAFEMVRFSPFPGDRNQYPHAISRMICHGEPIEDWCLDYTATDTSRMLMGLCVSCVSGRTISLYDVTAGKCISETPSVLAHWPASCARMRFVNIGNTSLLCWYDREGVRWMDPRRASNPIGGFVERTQIGHGYPEISPGGCFVKYEASRSGNLLKIHDVRMLASGETWPSRIGRYTVDVPHSLGDVPLCFDHAFPHSLYLWTREGQVILSTYLC